MSRRSKSSPVEAPGQDSFLDVVANLVGILIILVMVVGTQAKDAIVAEELERREQTDPVTEVAGSSEENAKLADVSAEEQAASAVESSLMELEGQLQRQELENRYRQAERDRLLALVAAAEKTLSEHRSELSADEQAKYDLENQLVSAKGELELLSKKPATMQKPSPSVIQHLPTPMAKTVFGKEIQFRLLEGKIVYIPWEEMLTRLKADVPAHASKLREVPRLERTLPVVGGFAGKYALRRVDDGRAARVELERLIFVQVESQMGEPVAQALRPGSDFHTRLAALPPKTTTITLWTYPDSFEEFRLLKAELFKQGYLVAARPMPAGFPIGGSPDGSRASAE